MPQFDAGSRSRFGLLRIAVVALMPVAIAGCQTASQSGGAPSSSKWVVDQIKQKCTASIVGGAIVGALIGAVAGDSRSAAKGAVIGGIAGVGVCAVAMALDAQDRERIREAQLRAAVTNQPQTLSYLGKDGLKRDIAVRPIKTVALPKPKPESPPVKASESSAPVSSDAVPATAGNDPIAIKTASGSKASEGDVICREIQTSASVETKGSTDIPIETLCREPDGSYAPRIIVASAT